MNNSDKKRGSKTDYLYKIILVGNSGVGKSAFIARYCHDYFNPVFVQTIGIDFKVKTLKKDDKRIKLQLWDTAGQERYQAITTAYYRGAHGFILMFDLTSERSFTACRMWMKQIKEMSIERAIIVLVGNKVDLTQQRVVNNADARKFASTFDIDYFETSAKDNINVNESIESIVDTITENIPQVIKPKDLPEDKSSKCSC